MKIVYNSDAHSLMQRIQEKTDTLQPYLSRKTCLTNPDVIQCSVNHNRIRLMKVSPNKKRMSQRIFRGKVHVKGEKTTISGRFAFEAFDIVLLLLCAFCTIPISLYYRDPHILKWKDLEISILLYFLYYIITYIVSVTYYHKEEKAIREFLESL